MAIVQLKDVVVERLNRSGFGVKVAEKYQVQGKERKTTYTLWFKEPHGLQEGDVISVSGFLGAKVSDPWVGQDGVERRSVELSVNSPRVDGHPSSRQEAPQESGDWATAQPGGGFGGSEEVPF